MAIPDLVTLSQTQTALAQILPTDQSALPTIISAASKAVQRYLRRLIPVADYAGILPIMAGQWDKNEPDVVELEYFPVQSSTLNPVVSVRCNRSTALLINCTDTTTNQRAFFSLVATGDPELGLQTNVGITLTRYASGVAITNSLPFFGTPTSTGFSVAASGSGSSLSTATYLCSYTNVNSAGESVRSADVSVSVTAGQNLVFTLPALIPQAASNNVYVSTAGGGSGTETKQNATAITGGTFTVTAVTAGASPPTTNTGTVSQLASAITALGGGWSATAQGPAATFGNWASNDLWGNQGATMGCLSTGQTQGLDVFQTDIPNVQCNLESGTLYLPQGGTTFGQGPGNVWQWPGSSDFAMGGAVWRDPVLVKYAAGYSTTPEDVQLATFMTIERAIYEMQTRHTYASEDADMWTGELANVDEGAIPQRARRLLSPYRVHRV